MSHKHVVGEEYEVRFKVRRIIKEYDDSYFKISRIEVLEYHPVDSGNTLKLSSDEVIYTNSPTLIIGNTYETNAVVIDSPKYGLNLQAIGEMKLIEPENLKEYRQFIQNSFSGIGDTFATRLVDLFGFGALDNLLNNKRALPMIGVPPVVAEQVIEQAEEMVHLNELIGFFNEFNIPVRIAVEVYESLGTSSREQIQSNPWSITSLDYQYFSYADKIGKTMSLEANNRNRVSSGILSYMRNRMNSGHMAVPAEELYGPDFRDWLNWVGEYEYLENNKITNEIIGEELKKLKDIWIIETPINEDGVQLIYFRTTLQTEDSIISAMSKVLQKYRSPLVTKSEPKTYLDALTNGDFLTKEDKLIGHKPFIPAEEQKNAIEMALTEPFSIITGGPGTGKTTVVNTIVEAIEYLRPGASITMLAPTGKAAKRMAEITKRPANTIHRKLNIQVADNDDDIRVIEDDYVIIDESSMVGAHLFSKLINNISDNTSVLLVGDVDQLPSVDSGAILRDFIDSGVIPTTRLLKVFRQAEESPIVSNAYKLNSGSDVDEMAFKPHSEMVFHEYPSEHDIQKLIIQYVHHLQSKMDLNDIAVLSPMKKGLLGVHTLNKELQKSINPEHETKQQITYSREYNIYLREGDRVMQTINDNDKLITNGETGVISAIYEEVSTDDLGKESSTTYIEVTYEDSYMGERTLNYTVQEARDQLELAYAITIHKSQGSEYRAVVIPFTKEHRYMLKRNLIYTAWTRAKEEVINIGSLKWVDYASKNNDNVLRYSQVKEKLRKI